MVPRHVYVHVPFCARRCSYCDFSIAVRREVPAEEYVAAMGRELELRALDGATTPFGEIETLYLGGGTPSRLGGEGIARLLALLGGSFNLAAGAEVTLEANPEDVTDEAAARWRESGVTRVSLGGQSFDDHALSWMHRTHDSAAIVRAANALRRAGIENFSLDLIFALPTSLERSWERDVACAIELEPRHLSLYGLTIEPATPLGRWRDRLSVAEAPEERYEREFLYAHDTLSAAGYRHYEVSNFGRPGAESRHNASYWSGVSYLGLGPSAHGFDGHTRRWNIAAYTAWLRALDARHDPVEGAETLTDENRAVEAVYLGLRTDTGLQVSPLELETVARWVEQGWATLDEMRVRLTPLGWLRLDSLAGDLTVSRSHY